MGEGGGDFRLICICMSIYVYIIVYWRSHFDCSCVMMTGSFDSGVASGTRMTQIPSLFNATSS